MEIKIAAVAWLAEADWPKWRELDPELQPTYAQWLVKVERAMAVAQHLGNRVVKVPMEPGAFADWARARGIKPDRNARSLFAALVASKKADH